MTDKDLKKLSRLELLEVMVNQGKEMENIQGQLTKARKLVETKNSKLEEVMLQYAALEEQLKMKEQLLEEANSQLKDIGALLEDANEQLNSTNAQLEDTKDRLRKTNEICDAMAVQLENRQLTLGESGSIAEASLRLNGVFEAAQKAADQYLENIFVKDEYGIRAEAEKRAQKLLWDTEAKCAKLEQQTANKCSKLERETVEKCAKLEKLTVTKCKEKEEKTKKSCEEALAVTKKKIEKYLRGLERQREKFYEENSGIKRAQIKGAEKATET